MQARKIGLSLFVIGVFFLIVHTILPFLWSVLGIPSAYPFASSEGFWMVLQGFTPPIGAFLLFLGGILYDKEPRRR